MFTGGVPFLLAQLEQLFQLLLHVPICFAQLRHSLEFSDLGNPAAMTRVRDSGFGVQDNVTTLLHVPICLAHLGHSLELPHLGKPAVMFRVWDSTLGI